MGDNNVDRQLDGNWKRESRLKRKVAGATWLVEVDRQQQQGEALLGKFCCCDTLSEIGIF